MEVGGEVEVGETEGPAVVDIEVEEEVEVEVEVEVEEKAPVELR